MKPLRTIPLGAEVFVDANILALAAFDNTQLGQICRTFLERIQNQELSGFTATFVAAEVMHRTMVNEAREQLQRSSRETVEYLQRHPEMVRRMTRHLSVASDISQAGIDILPTTIKDLHASKNVRRDYGLLTNDSLIVALMHNNKLTHLATHDAGFRAVAGLQLWMPG